jgi:hypothetical protein
MSEKSYPMLELTLSGSYRTADKDIIDFEGVKCLIPACDEAIGVMHAQSRYAYGAIKSKMNGQKPAYPKRIEDIRQVFIDDIKPAEGPVSFVGKDIKELSFDELQDLATRKDLRTIPLPKELSGMDLREARVRAYVAYNDKVLRGKPIKWGDEDFNFAKLPSITMDYTLRAEGSKKISNEEIIEREQSSKSTDADNETTMELEDLLALAKEKGINTAGKTGKEIYDELYIAA